MKTLTLLLILAVGACATEPGECTISPDRAVEWHSSEFVTYNNGVEVVNTMECSPSDYPSVCPLMSSAQRVTVEQVPDGRYAITWWALASGSGVVNVLASKREDGCLWVNAGSDNTGLRHEFALCPTADECGYEGVVEWTLRARAGHARFGFVTGD